jgi:hypothetical protein
VTVFNRAQAAPGQSQVVAYALKDARGGHICKATIQETWTTRDHVVLPRKITLVWPAQRLEMKLQLFDTQVVQIDPQRADRLFRRTDLSGLQSYDLARRAIDGPGGRSGPASRPGEDLRGRHRPARAGGRLSGPAQSRNAIGCVPFFLLGACPATPPLGRMRERRRP